MIVGLAALAAIARVTGIQLGLKWPNDLVVTRDAAAGSLDGSQLGDAKVAGVLSELVASPDGPIVVAGIGINVGWPAAAADRTGELANAASLVMLGAEPERVALLVALIEELAPRRAQLDSSMGRDALAAEVRSVSATLGRRVRVDRTTGATGESIEGIAESIDAIGRLVVRGDDGVEHLVGVGDVHHLRPLDE